MTSVDSCKTSTSAHSNVVHTKPFAKANVSLRTNGILGNSMWHSHLLTANTKEKFRFHVNIRSVCMDANLPAKISF